MSSGQHCLIEATEVAVVMVTKEGARLTYRFGEGDGSKVINVGVEYEVDYAPVDSLFYKDPVGTFVTGRRMTFTIPS